MKYEYLIATRTLGLRHLPAKCPFCPFRSYRLAGYPDAAADREMATPEFPRMLGQRIKGVLDSGELSHYQTIHYNIFITIMRTSR